MKRFRIIGLALAAVFVSGAVAVAVAQAAEPEYVVPGGFPKTFLATAGAGKLETMGGRKVECTSGAGEGTINAAKETDKTLVTFIGCTATGPFGIKVSCKSATLAGVITTNSLVSKLRFLSLSPLVVGTVLEPETSGGLFAKFECGGIQELKVRGTSIGEVTTLNSNEKTHKLKFAQTAGLQKWLEYEEEGGTKVKPAENETEGKSLSFGGENFGFEPSAVEGESTQELTTGEKWEIKG